MISDNSENRTVSLLGLDERSVRTSKLSENRLSIMDGKVVLPSSLASYRDVTLYDGQGNAHQILDGRHLVLRTHIKGATGLRGSDCRRFVPLHVMTCCYI